MKMTKISNTLMCRMGTNYLIIFAFKLLVNASKCSHGYTDYVNSKQIMTYFGFYKFIVT